ncbi:MAG: FAD-binding protein [Clostridiales bacterium]|nr:FAD-binding protein [Clostridiales bacterium]
MEYQASAKERLAWPYPVHYGKVNRVTVDVLVIGGGLAGGCAGLAAVRRGCTVAVVDKAPIKRSGCGGAGMDHWNNVLNHEGSPMTPEENLEKGNTQARQGHRDYIAVKGTWDALMELEKLGLPIRDEDGDFVGTATLDRRTNLLKAYNYQDLVAVKLRGGQYIKPVIYEGLRREGAQLFERVMVTSLLTEGGKQGARVIGATGLSMETGEFYVFSAKSTILSSGYACTIWTYSTEITGNSYRWDPNDIGDGLAMAWKAGAQVFGMDKAGHTRAAHPFAWPRFGVGNPSNTWFPCTIVDNNGKEVPWEDADGKLLTSIEARNLPTEHQVYCGSTISDVLKSVAPPNLIHDLPERIRKGEFELPLWADISAMPEDERRSIWGVMIGNEGKSRYTIYDLYTREGFDPDTDMLMAPIMVPEGYLSGGWFQGEPNAVKPWRSESFGCQGEPAMDWNLMTSLDGLFVAGSSGGLEGCSYACSSGFYAGNRAAEFGETVERGEVDQAQLDAELLRVYAPVMRAGDPDAYISWKELWGGSARVMQQCCGDFKTIPILEHGLKWLDSIKQGEMQHTYARNPHELAKVMEDESRITVSEMFLQACIVKIKTDKSDLPAGTYIFNQLVGDQVVTTYKEPQYWLKAPYAPTYLENYERCRAKEGQA